MIDILVYLFENYTDLSRHPKSGALARKLSAVGFDAEEITSALDWLDGLKAAETPAFSTDPRSLRVYTQEERTRLGSDCLDFIAFLQTAGVITPALRELVVERAMMFDHEPVSLARFKIIVLIVLWSREHRLEPLIVEELLYGSDPETMH